MKRVKAKYSLIIIAKGVPHMSVADDEVHVLLIEPKTTLNTGDAVSDHAKKELGRI